MLQGERYETDKQFDYEFEGEVPYFFLSSITKRRTIKGKSYIVRSYFKGGKDFNETLKRLAVKQAYKDAR